MDKKEILNIFSGKGRTDKTRKPTKVFVSASLEMQTCARAVARLFKDTSSSSIAMKLSSTDLPPMF